MSPVKGNPPREIGFKERRPGRKNYSCPRSTRGSAYSQGGRSNLNPSATASAPTEGPVTDSHDIVMTFFIHFQRTIRPFRTKFIAQKTDAADQNCSNMPYRRTYSGPRNTRSLRRHRNLPSLSASVRVVGPGAELPREIALWVTVTAPVVSK